MEEIVGGIKPIYHHYIIDMSSNNNFVENPTMQGDGNGVRGIEIELIANGTQYVVDRDNTIVSIIGTKPDTAHILNRCVVTDEGYILVDIDSQMSAVKGRGGYCIMLMDKNKNSQIKSFPFYIMTTSAPFDIDYIVSSDEFQLLTKTVIDAGTVADNAKKEIENMQNLEDEVSANEAIRISNENVRILNENNREDAESSRENDTATAISNANLATQNANTATQNAIDATTATNTATENANTATQKANTVITQMESLMKNDNVVHSDKLGVAGGVATLDEDGFLTASQIPDRTIEYYYGILNKDTQVFTDSKGNIIEGKTNKMYIDITENIPYVWSGIEFVATGSKLGLGYTSSTAFPGFDGLILQEKVSVIEEYHNNIPASDIKFDNSNTPILGATVQDAIEDLTETATPIRNGLLSADDKKLIDNYANIQTIEITLLSSKWMGSTSPFTQIITVTDLSLYNNCSIELSPSATPIQTATIIDACITNIQYDESIGLTFTAYGKKPTIDIPILICVGTSMNVVEVPKYIETPYKAESISYDSSDNISANNVQDAIDLIGSQLGTTDISALGDGTCTGAIAAQNEALATAIATLNKQYIQYGVATCKYYTNYFLRVTVNLPKKYRGSFVGFVTKATNTAEANRHASCLVDGNANTISIYIEDKDGGFTQSDIAKAFWMTVGVL